MRIIFNKRAGLGWGDPSRTCPVPIPSSSRVCRFAAIEFEILPLSNKINERMAQRLFSRLSLLQSLCRIPKPRLEPRSTFLTLFSSTNLLSWFYFLKSHVWCFRLEALSDSITSRNGVNLWVSHNLQGLP